MASFVSQFMLSTSIVLFKMDINVGVIESPSFDKRDFKLREPGEKKKKGFRDVINNDVLYNDLE